jgi:amidophosphoribosyltransferase
VVSTATCAFHFVEADYVREIEPGEILHISKDGARSFKPLKKATHNFCIFEYIYFARPDSDVFGRTVYGVRSRNTL